MPARSRPDLDELTTPDRLVPLLEGLPVPAVVGFEPTPDHLAIHFAELPPDDRAAAAGLFGLRAEAWWTAAGVVVEGRARSTVDGGGDLGRVRLGVVVSRDGTHAHSLEPLGPGDHLACGTLDAPPPEGLLIDALLRVLGRPSASPTPPPHVVALTMWSHEIVSAALDGARPDWAELVALHPGAVPSTRVTPPSVESMAEATRRTGGRVDWASIHRRAVHGDGPLPPDLDRSEAAWMDAPMYARWALGTLASPGTAAVVLRAHGCTAAADRFDAVRAALGTGGAPSSTVTDG